MVLLSDVGGVAGFTQTLQSISIPPDVINELVSMLDTDGESLADSQSKFHRPQSAAFGGTSAAHSLGKHTVKAHARLTNSILEAVASLQATTEAMKQFHREMGGVDADSGHANRLLLVRTSHAVDIMDDNRHTPPEHPGHPGGKH